MNAFQEGLEDSLRHARGTEQHVPLLPGRARRTVQSDASDEQADALDRRPCFNSDEFASIERLTETAGEFPRIDDRRTGLPYRYGWFLGDGHEAAGGAQGRQRGAAS